MPDLFPRLVLTLVLCLCAASGAECAGNDPPADGRIVTVLGEIDPDELGTTLMHEHLLIDFTLPLDEPERWRLAPRPYPDTREKLEIWHMPFGNVRQREFMLQHLWANRDTLLLQDVDVAIAEIRSFRDLGGRAIVDLTSTGIGRSPERLRDIAAQSGVHVVMGAGWYHHAWHPADVATRSVDSLADEIRRDLTTGVGDTGVRAGIIGEVSAMAVSVSPGDSAEAKVLRAAARASRSTGAAISLHQWIRDGKMLEVTLEILEAEGADLSRVILGHIDGRAVADLPNLQRLMDRGLVLEFDLLGTPYLLARPELDDRPMADAVIALVKAGYGDRLLLSQDVCTKLQLETYGGHGYGYLQRHVVPYLLANGLTERDVRQIQLHTPRRLLTIER